MKRSIITLLILLLAFMLTGCLILTDADIEDLNAADRARYYLSVGVYSEYELRHLLALDGYSIHAVNYAISDCNINFRSNALRDARVYMNTYGTLSALELAAYLEADYYTDADIEYVLDYYW